MMREEKTRIIRSFVNSAANFVSLLVIYLSY